jgi:hypothetical protein
MNDLVGLGYGWGHRPGDGSGLTDCFQLACEVRDRLGLTSYREHFAWVYRDWDEQTFPRSMIVRWVLEHGSPLKRPQRGAVALLPAGGGTALGTCLGRALLFIGPGQNVVQAPLPDGVARYFWMDR